MCKDNKANFLCEQTSLHHDHKLFMIYDLSAQNQSEIAFSQKKNYFSFPLKQYYLGNFFKNSCISHFSDVEI